MGYVILLITMFITLLGIPWLNYNVFNDAVSFSSGALSFILLCAVSVIVGNIYMNIYHKMLDKKSND